MATETTTLTDEQIEQGREATFSTNNPYCPCDSKTMRKAARWAEQAVLQSDQVQAWKRDAGRYRWLKANIQDGYGLPGGYYIPDEDTHTWDKTIGAAMKQKP